MLPNIGLSGEVHTSPFTVGEEGEILWRPDFCTAQIFRAYFDAQSDKPEIVGDAYKWLTSDDDTWEFSFLKVCEWINVNPDIPRRRIMAVLNHNALAEYLGAEEEKARQCDLFA